MCGATVLPQVLLSKFLFKKTQLSGDAPLQSNSNIPNVTTLDTTITNEISEWTSASVCIGTYKG